jgi:hypothetical protein
VVFLRGDQGMDIEKGNNQAETDYHIISIGYTASTIAPTTLWFGGMRPIEDLQMK